MNSITSPQSDSALARLPVEVLQRVSLSLTTTAFCAVRLTCRKLEQATFDEFARSFFRRKQFMLTEPSLEALGAISRHPTLSRYLEHLIIGLDRYGLTNALGTPEQEAALHRGRAGQLGLLASGGAVSLLADALRGLPKLQTVDIRDFNNTRRSRDGPLAQWRSYGVGTVAAETGYRMAMHDPTDLGDWSGQVFCIVLAAMAAAAVRPPNLEVILRTNRRLQLKDFAFQIPRSFEASMRPVLGGLRKLHLDIEAHQPPAESCLGRFLSCTPNVAWLRLNFRVSMRLEGNPLLDWLAGGVATDGTPLLAGLAQLDIGHVDTTRATLLAVATRYAATLRGLSLRRVFLAEASSRRDPVGLWQDFLRRLCGATELRSLSLAFPYVRPSVIRTPVRVFLGKSESGSNAVERGFSGDVSEVRRFIDELVRDTVVDWPEGASSDSDSNSDEEDEW